MTGSKVFSLVKGPRSQQTSHQVRWLQSRERRHPFECKWAGENRASCSTCRTWQEIHSTTTHLCRNGLINDTVEESVLICLSSQLHNGGMCDLHGQLGMQSLKVPQGTAIDIILWRQKRLISWFNLSLGSRRDQVEEPSSYQKLHRRLCLLRITDSNNDIM